MLCAKELMSFEYSTGLYLLYSVGGCI